MVNSKFLETELCTIPFDSLYCFAFQFNCYESLQYSSISVSRCTVMWNTANSKPHETELRTILFKSLNRLHIQSNCYESLPAICINSMLTKFH